MRNFFDTSAFVPLLIREGGTATAVKLWRASDAVYVSRMLFVEAPAALAQAERMGRIDAPLHERLRRDLAVLLDDVEVVEADRRLVDAAAEFARRFSLRAFDAVQCASAAALRLPGLVAIAGDRTLLAAWQELDLMTADVNSD